jgi:hypothetical protein
MLFIDGILKKEEENELANENSGMDADDPDAACTFLGGERAHNVIIKAEYNPKQPNNPDYTISIVNKADVVSESDIELLAAIGKPAPEELKQMFLDDPDLKNYPDWFNYGYQFQKIYKPTPVKNGQENTKIEDLSVSDDEEETPAPRKAAKAPAKVAKVEEEDDFSVNLVVEDDLDLMM